MASREAVAAGVGVVIAGLLAAGAVVAATRGTTHHSQATSPTKTTPAGAATAAASAGTTLRDEADNISVAVPTAWQSPAQGAGNYADIVRSFTDKNPQFRTLVAQRATKATSTVGLFAVDPASHTTLIIQSAAAAPDATAGATSAGVLPGPLVDQYEKLGIQVIGTETVQLSLGPVLHAALGLVVSGQELAIDQYFFVDGPKIVTITIEGPGGNKNLALHDQIARSAHRG